MFSVESVFVQIDGYTGWLYNIRTFDNHERVYSNGMYIWTALLKKTKRKAFATNLRSLVEIFPIHDIIQ